jgi:hypothetical protein
MEGERLLTIDDELDVLLDGELDSGDDILVVIWESVESRIPLAQFGPPLGRFRMFGVVG